MKVKGIISMGEFYIPIVEDSILDGALRCESRKRRWKCGKGED